MKISLQYPQESLRKNSVASGARRNPSAQGRRYPASRRPFIQFVGINHDHHGRIDIRYAAQTGKIGWTNFDPRAFRYGWMGVDEKEQKFFGTDTDDELVFGRSGNAAMVVKNIAGAHPLECDLVRMLFEVLNDLFLVVSLLDHVLVIHRPVFRRLRPCGLAV